MVQAFQVNFVLRVDCGYTLCAGIATQFAYSSVVQYITYIKYTGQLLQHMPGPSSIVVYQAHVIILSK